VVLIGDSGSGKSTLAATLALTGDALLADDCALVQDGAVYATGRGCRLDAGALKRLAIAGVEVDATGKGLVDERHGLRLAGGPVALNRLIVVGERNAPLGVAEAFEILTRQRFWMRRPATRALLDETALILAGRPQVMEIDWASPDILKRVRDLAARG
jgi:ABC-type dipeptide/oligopeptide/nickel transport system ATPase component